MTKIQIDSKKVISDIEDMIVDKLEKRGHNVIDLRKDPVSPAKFVIQINSEFDKIDMHDILSLGTIAFYYIPLRHFVIEQEEWRPHNSRGKGNMQFEYWS